jgi:hypothetical protein
MRGTARKAAATGRRIQGFLKAEAGVVGTAASPEVQAELDGLVSQLETYAVQQDEADGSATAHTALQEEYRKDAYVRFVRPIARISKRYLSLAPEITALVVTADDTRSPDVVTKLTKLANAAEVHHQTLVAKGMPSDFVAQLRTAIAQFTTTMDVRDRYIGTRAAATTGLNVAQRELRGLIEQLDSLLLPVLRGNQAVLADWISTKHIPKLTVNPLPTGGVMMDDTSANEGTPTDAPAPAASLAPPAAPKAA